MKQISLCDKSLQSWTLGIPTLSVVNALQCTRGCTQLRGAGCISRRRNMFECVSGGIAESTICSIFTLKDISILVSLLAVSTKWPDQYFLPITSARIFCLSAHSWDKCNRIPDYSPVYISLRGLIMLKTFRVACLFWKKVGWGPFLVLTSVNCFLAIELYEFHVYLGSQCLSYARDIQNVIRQ